MPAKPVQISLDTKLLARIDRDPQTKREGRSAFVRAAVLHYFAEKQRRTVDDQIRAGYAARPFADRDAEELDAWQGEQVWPDE